ncbi:TPA: hypothetical protein DCZ15_02830 [Candidatus Falkowbacteria bacterium]|nr:MAG: hypothetical protein UV95_C0001G0224 [Candidatus Falkowbacteria bacterium GW2011_GWF2_43_32]HBA36791.1 hypothetical protein [Candidatus Falkowbacteria bacterium]
MLWLNFLHFYQPANADFHDIRKALDKSYWRLIRWAEEHPDLRFTVNVSGCLLERLLEEKESKFIDHLKFLVKKGRLELTGSAAYHGFLPLLSEEEIVRQIKTNEKILKKCFGKNFKPTGFFLPEMAYSPTVAKIIKRLGYRWIILDEIAYSGASGRRPDIQRPYADEATGLKVIFRDRALSNGYPPDKLQAIFKKTPAGTQTLLTATDAELYGLRHEDPTAELEKVAKIKELKTLTVSAFLKSIEKNKTEKIKLWPSSWESSVAEVKSGRPFRLWLDKSNKIQTNLWKLANLSLETGRKFKNDKNFFWYRWHLIRGLASCTFWWASGRDFSKVFGPYAWSPDDIERGLEDLIRSLRSLADPKTKKIKLEAEKYYLRTKKLIWEEHWKKYWQKII